MVKVRYLNGKTVYLPCTPSEWLSQPLPSVESCLKLTITSGGGMGGSKWKRFVKAIPTDIIPSNQLMKFTNIITNEEIVINTSFIVEIKEMNFFKVSYHSDNKHVGVGDKNLYFCTDKTNNKIMLSNKYRMISEYTSKP